MQSNLLMSIHDRFNPQKIYFYLFNSVTRFRLSLKSINWKAQRWRGEFEEPRVHVAYYRRIRLLVTLPAGNIQIRSGFHFTRDSAMMFMFNLNDSLRNKLTFYTIYFPVSLPVCHRHHLYITKYKWDFRYEIYDHHKIFCGYLPTFSYYPGYNRIILGILRRTNDETFIVENSFTVMDKNVIVSLSNQNIKYYDKNLGRIYDICYVF